MKKRLGPYAHFGIIDEIDIDKDYSQLNGDFQGCLAKYQCVDVPDMIINGWWDSLTKMKTYFHTIQRPATALARWGVTLIPPESLDTFIDIVLHHTNEYFHKYCEDKITLLLDLLARAKQEEKYVIHYGV